MYIFFFIRIYTILLSSSPLLFFVCAMRVGRVHRIIYELWSFPLKCIFICTAYSILNIIIYFKDKRITWANTCMYIWLIWYDHNIAVIWILYRRAVARSVKHTHAHTYENDESTTNGAARRFAFNWRTETASVQRNGFNNTN